jgi:glycerol-3-phosphate acyltransferase PlsX
MSSPRIALDAMGGDQAPASTVRGAARAIDPAGHVGLDPERLLLVGDEARLRPLLDEVGASQLEVLHAPETIGMGESPSTALRKKQRSSIALGVRAVAEGKAGAFVSMGNTGACVGASTLTLKTLEGVRRPGIAVTLELTGHPLTILDMGANIAPKPEHLRDYGVMGAIYSRDCLQIPEPRVGLLNVGEEPSKGTDVLKEAHKLLADSKLQFLGNVEGGDLFDGSTDVVVADGFTGNVVLKLLEGFAGFLLMLVLRELKAHKVQWSEEALARVKKNIDYSEYGGALLLGVDGIVVIGHGRSDARAVANALGQAARAMDAEVNEAIVKRLAEATTRA